jgi:septal ring factor EnvC (AmiA/AmiB activator)
MGSETFLQFIKAYVDRLANREILEQMKGMESEWRTLLDDKNAFREEKNKQENYVKHLETENKSLKNKLESYQDEHYKLTRHNYTLQEEIEKLNKELKKQYQFESHIKELLKQAA